MSEMVNRVAEAISVSFHEEGYIEGISNPSEWEEFLKAARAAIKAMREPTEAMCDAGGSSDFLMWSLEEGEGLDGTNMEMAWYAMVDEALK